APPGLFAPFGAGVLAGGSPWLVCAPSPASGADGCVVPAVGRPGFSAGSALPETLRLPPAGHACHALVSPRRVSAHLCLLPTVALRLPPRLPAETIWGVSLTQHIPFFSPAAPPFCSRAGVGRASATSTVLRVLGNRLCRILGRNRSC